MDDRGGHAQFPAVQALRFLAALSVAIYHLGHYSEQAGTIAPGYFSLFSIFSGGVVVLFAISGFLMAMLSEVQRPLMFLGHRALRIYPAFWVACAAALLLNFPRHAPLRATGALPVLLNMPMGPLPPILNVEWTLVYEVFFYGAVAIMCAVGARARTSVIALWCAGIVMANGVFGWPGPVPQPTVMEIAFSPYDLMFIGGVLTWWSRSRIAIHPGLLCIFGIGLFALTETTPDWYIRSGLMVVGSSCFLLAASCTKTNSVFSARSFLVRCGNGSYGLYLIHVIIMSALLTYSPFRGWTAALGVLAVTVVLGTAFGRWEHMLYNMTKRKFDDVLQDLLRVAAPGAVSRAVAEPG